MKLCVKNVAFSVKIDINRKKYGFLQTVICRIKKKYCNFVPSLLEDTLKASYLTTQKIIQ